MPRGKLAMELINNPKKRKATYKNRRDGLVQKLSQLETLCGVEGFLVCYGPLAGADEVTTWPPDRDDVLRRVQRFRATPGDKLQNVVDAPAFLQDELAKQQRKLLGVAQCGAGERLGWDHALDDLPAAGLNALHGELEETLQRVQRRIVALGGSLVVHEDDGGGSGVVPPSSGAAVVAAAPVPQAMMQPDNAYDFAFVMPPDAGGSMFTQYYYPPCYDMLPQPVPLQPPCLGFQMPPPPPCLGFQMPPPTLLAPDFGMTAGAGTMEVMPYATNSANGAASVAGFYGDIVPGFPAAGGGCVDEDDVLAQGFAAGHGSAAGYGDPANHMAAGVWPLTWLNDSTDDGASFQLENDSAALPGSSTSSSSFQGGGFH